MTPAERFMPAQAGIQTLAECWIPCHPCAGRGFAGMTVKALMSGHDFVKTQ